MWKAAGLAPVADVVNFAKGSHDIEMMRQLMISHDFSDWAPDVVLVATSTNDDNAAKFSENNYAIVAAHVEDFVNDVGNRVADCAGGTRPAFVFFEDSLAGLDGTVEGVEDIHLAQGVHERVAEETLSPVISWRDIMEPVLVSRRAPRNTRVFAAYSPRVPPLPGPRLVAHDLAEGQVRERRPRRFLRAEVVAADGRPVPRRRVALEEEAQDALGALLVELRAHAHHVEEAALLERDPGRVGAVSYTHLTLPTKRIV